MSCLCPRSALRQQRQCQWKACLFIIVLVHNDHLGVLCLFECLSVTCHWPALWQHHVLHAISWVGCVGCVTGLARVTPAQDSRVKLVEAPAHKVAVISFSWSVVVPLTRCTAHRHSAESLHRPSKVTAPCADRTMRNTGVLQGLDRGTDAQEGGRAQVIDLETWQLATWLVTSPWQQGASP